MNKDKTPADKSNLILLKRKMIANPRCINLILASGLFLLFLLLALFAVFSPAIKTDSISKPSVLITDNLVNSKEFRFELSDGQGIYIEYNGARFFDKGTSVSVKDIAEGKAEFRIHRMQDYLFFKLISEEFKIVWIEFDFTPPDIHSLINVKSEYYQENNKISFATTENSILIEQDLAGTVKRFTWNYSTDNNPDAGSLSCSSLKGTDTDNIIYTCPLDLNEEKKFKINMSVSDLAGNKAYIFENQDIEYVIPVSLVCEGLPIATNLKNFTYKCKANKSGFYFVGEEKKEITKDQSVDYQFIIEKEGLNTVVIKTADKQNREFYIDYQIILDTTAPDFILLDMPSKFTICSPFAIPPFGSCTFRKVYLTIKFKPNENISGYLRTKPKKISSGSVSVGGSYNTFKLSPGQEFSKTIYANSYGEGLPASEYINSDIIVEIEMIDDAGNKKFHTQTIKANVIE